MELDFNIKHVHCIGLGSLEVIPYDLILKDPTLTTVLCF